ncbi:hypothetical protein STEG23_032985, partial [Scotinomys teguina]
TRRAQAAGGRSSSSSTVTFGEKCWMGSRAHTFEICLYFSLECHHTNMGPSKRCALGHRSACFYQGENHQDG